MCWYCSAVCTQLQAEKPLISNGDSFPFSSLLRHFSPSILSSGLPRAREHTRFKFRVWLCPLRCQRCVKRAAGPAAASCCSPPFHKVFQVPPIILSKSSWLWFEFDLRDGFFCCCCHFQFFVYISFSSARAEAAYLTQVRWAESNKRQSSKSSLFLHIVYLFYW